MRCHSLTNYYIFDRLPDYAYLKQTCYFRCSANWLESKCNALWFTFYLFSSSFFPFFFSTHFHIFTKLLEISKMWILLAVVWIAMLELPNFMICRIPKWTVRNTSYVNSSSSFGIKTITIELMLLSDALIVLAMVGVVFGSEMCVWWDDLNGNVVWNYFLILLLRSVLWE